MKAVMLLAILLLTPKLWCQQQHHFPGRQMPLVQLLKEIETKFDVRYSYADSIAEPMVVSVNANNYTLQQLNDDISKQTNLDIIKISERFYSLVQKNEVPIGEPLDEIKVFTFLSKGILKEGQEIIILPDKVQELPGVTDADILLSLQQLPGVKSPNETASGLHVRGGTADQNLILWDGIRMYHPGHLFGMISGLNPNVKQKVHYYNKAVNPKLGERISSVIDIRTNDEIAEKVAGTAGLNALDADVFVQVPLVKQKVGFQLGIRKSFTEQVQSPTFNSLAQKVFQNTDFRKFDDENQFGFSDLFAKLSFKLNDTNDFSVTGISIDNNLDFNTTDEASLQKVQRMSIRNYGAAINWKHRYNQKLTHHVLLHYSLYTFDYQRTQYQQESYDSFSKLNRVLDSGAELNYIYKATSNLHADFGYLLFGNDISHSFTSATPGIIVELDQKHQFNVTHAGYLNLRYELERWRLNGGIRYNYFGHLKQSNVEPRAFIEKDLSDHVVWQLSFEQKSQIASQARESVINDLSLENYIWVLADNSTYPIQKGRQYTTGFVYKSKPLVVDVDLYYKTLDGITSMNFGLLHDFDAAQNRGHGFTKGVDLLLQKNALSWSIWMTYTYQDSQNRYDNINNGRYFATSSDTRHALSISYFKKWGNYSVSTGWFLHSGRPYSQLNDNDQVEFLNDKRLPSYHRLNVSGAYEFTFRGASKGRFGFSIFNAYNQRTVISKEYERIYANIGDVDNPRYTLRNYYSLGFTPNIFFRINF
jgi:hypothetical protein